MQRKPPVQFEKLYEFPYGMRPLHSARAPETPGNPRKPSETPGNPRRKPPETRFRTAATNPKIGSVFPYGARQSSGRRPAGAAASAAAAAAAALSPRTGVPTEPTLTFFLILCFLVFVAVADG